MISRVAKMLADGRTGHVLRMNGELLVRREGIVHKIECLVEDRGADLEKLFQVVHLVLRMVGAV